MDHHQQKQKYFRVIDSVNYDDLLTLFLNKWTSHHLHVAIYVYKWIDQLITLCVDAMF